MDIQLYFKMYFVDRLAWVLSIKIVVTKASKKVQTFMTDSSAAAKTQMAIVIGLQLRVKMN